MIFQALPLVIDHVSSQLGHICVVVSPLLTLVDDQVEYLSGKGVTAASISSCTEEEATLIEKGKISVVFGSPEAWIQTNGGEQCLEILCIPKNYVLWPSTKPT